MAPGAGRLSKQCPLKPGTALQCSHKTTCACSPLCWMQHEGTKAQEDPGCTWGRQAGTQQLPEATRHGGLKCQFLQALAASTLHEQALQSTHTTRAQKARQTPQHQEENAPGRVWHQCARELEIGALLAEGAVINKQRPAAGAV